VSGAAAGGAIPPAQLPAVLQLTFPPLPFHVEVAASVEVAAKTKKASARPR
jgi:hypothetical protein